MLPTSLDILPKLSMKITPEAIGATISPFCDFPLKFNMAKEGETGASEAFGEAAEVPKINIGGLEVELTSSFIRRVALVIVGIVFVPLLILYLCLANLLIPKEQAKLDGINKDITSIKAKLAVYSNNAQGNTFNLNSTMSKIGTSNKSQIIYYMSLGLGIPNKLWVTYYLSNEDGKVDIKGKSSNVESIYAFYKNIKQLVNNSDVKLYKLEIASDSLADVVQSVSSPRYYQFEITNMSDAELNPPTTDDKTKPADNKQDPNAQKPPAGSTNPTGFQFDSAPSAKAGKASDKNQPSPSGGQAANKLPNAPQPPSQPSPPKPNIGPNQQQSGGDKLPKNLQKIEKF